MSKRTLSGNQMGVLFWVFNGHGRRDYSEKTGSENIRTIGSLVRLGLICSDHDPITYHSLNRWVVTFDGLYTLSDAGLITESERDAVMKPQPQPAPAPEPEPEPIEVSDIPFAAVDEVESAPKRKPRKPYRQAWPMHHMPLWDDCPRPTNRYIVTVVDGIRVRLLGDVS